MLAAVVAVLITLLVDQEVVVVAELAETVARLA
jgi:hypothetical protein